MEVCSGCWLPCGPTCGASLLWLRPRSRRGLPAGSHLQACPCIAWSLRTGGVQSLAYRTANGNSSRAGCIMGWAAALRVTHRRPGLRTESARLEDAGPTGARGWAGAPLPLSPSNLSRGRRPSGGRSGLLCSAAACAPGHHPRRPLSSPAPSSPHCPLSRLPTVAQEPWRPGHALPCDGGQGAVPKKALSSDQQLTVICPHPCLLGCWGVWVHEPDGRSRTCVGTLHLERRGHP